MPPVASALSACSFSFQPGITPYPPCYPPTAPASLAAPLSTSTLLVSSHRSPYFRPSVWGRSGKRQPSLRSVPPQSCSARHAPLVANRLGLTLNVGEEGQVVIPLQPHFDEDPEDDLEAHRELERGRRLPRQDPSPVQNVLRENEEDFRLIREHHHSLPAQLTPDRTRSPHLEIYKL